MRTNAHQNLHSFIWIFLFVVAVLCTPSTASAQAEHSSNAVVDLTRSVLFDPTTYAPAALAYTSQRMDWNTSQVLFKAGFVEHNPLYTISGRPDDTPIGFDAGNRQIRRAAIGYLQQSLVNNLSTQILERALTQKYPQHQKVFKTLGWVERIGFSSYVAYLASADHFTQVQKNRQLARAYGIR